MPQGESLDELLQPSLTRGAAFKPVYSVRAGFFVAFLGGPFAAIAFGVLNSRRAGRLAEDLWLFAAFAAVGAAFVLWTAALVSAPVPPEWVSYLGGTRRAPRIIGTALALAGFGLIARRHRLLYAASELRGETPPSPWGPGLAAVLLGQALTAAFAILGVALG